jgi:hypothetical protein
MTDLARLFDAYNRQARLYPALVTILPAIALILAAFPKMLTSGGALVGIAGASGLIFFLGDVGRTFGKRLEQALLRNWGGWPTTIWLRHSSSNLVSATKARYHSVLQRHVPGLVLPTKEDERTNPRQADEAYASAVEWLKERSRGKDFPLVQKENANYGFRRNLRGLKPIGMLISLLAFSASVYLLIQAIHWPWTWKALGSVDPTVAAAAGFALLMLLLWTFFVTPSWVRQAGDAYARALLACCDTIDGGASLKPLTPTPAPPAPAS